MALYATVEEIKGLGLQTDASDPDAWDLVAESASRAFDRLTEVPEDFYAPAAWTSDDPPEPVFTERTFYGDGYTALRLDPFITLNPVSPVVFDPSENIAVPSYRIRNGYLILAKDSYLKGWPDVPIIVSAHWGFNVVPADIKMAVAKLAMQYWRTTDPINAEESEGAAEPLIDGIPATAYPIITAYREMYSKRAAF